MPGWDMQTNRRTGPANSAVSRRATSTRCKFLEEREMLSSRHRPEWQSLPACCMESSPFVLLLQISSLQCLRPSSDEGTLWKGSRQRLQRRGNGGVRAGAGRHWPATQPPGLQIRSDMSKCGAQFHNHCSALHQRQPARQYRCVTLCLIHLLFPPCSYCLSVSNMSR